MKKAVRKVIGDCYNQYVDIDYMKVGPTLANSFPKISSNAYGPHIFRVSRVTNTRLDYGFFYYRNTTADQRAANAHLWIERVDENYEFHNKNSYPVHVKIDVLTFTEADPPQAVQPDFSSTYFDCFAPNLQKMEAAWRQDTRATDSADPLLAMNINAINETPEGPVNTTDPTVWEAFTRDTGLTSLEHMHAHLSWVFPKLPNIVKIKRWKYFTVPPGKCIKFKKSLPVMQEVTWQKVNAWPQSNVIKNKTRAYFFRMWTDRIAHSQGLTSPSVPTTAPVNLVQFNECLPATLDVVCRKTVAWRVAGDSKPTFIRYEPTVKTAAANFDWTLSSATRSWNWLHSLGGSDGINAQTDATWLDVPVYYNRVHDHCKYSSVGAYYTYVDGVFCNAFP